MAGRFEGKVAIVTGGTRGIGRAIAGAFVAQGACVAVCGRDRATLDAAVSELRVSNPNTLAIGCDVSNENEVRAMVRQVVKRFERLDILINNAGVRASITTIEDLTEDEWQRTFDIDAKGTWLCSKYAIPAMRQAGGGSIIMVSPVSAHVGQPKQGCSKPTRRSQWGSLRRWLFRVDTATSTMGTYRTRPTAVIGST